MGKVFCVGHAAYDITLPVPSFPLEDKKYRILKSIECGGGSANVAASLLARWKEEVYFFGAIGKDEYGKRIKEEMRNEGINFTYLEETSDFKTTASYIIANTSKGTRTIISNRDKKRNAIVDLSELDVVPDVIYTDVEEPEITRKLILQFPNAISILDAGNKKDSTVSLAPCVDYIVASKDYAEEVMGEKIDVLHPEKLYSLYDRLQAQYKGKLVITLGKDGSFTKIDNRYCLFPSIKVEAVDSTAAGDIYHGAFTYFLMQGYSLKDVMNYANIAGALSTMKMGSKYTMPTKEEVIHYQDVS